MNALSWDGWGERFGAGLIHAVMQILSVTLSNFKTHRDRHFQFQPGTNAICGENGAGKTSILEAIAWVLFNYTGDYNKADLIRNGTHSAQVTVTLVSAKDSRTYEIQRCTNRGYTLFDPQLGERLPYSRIQDEIMPWLREHLGVVPGTDLSRLFANTIGIPQGTFTADFLLPAEKRKPIFDAVLKVEEYRLANQKMLSLEKYAKGQSAILQDRIEQYEATLAQWDELLQRQDAVRQTIAEKETQLQQLQTEIAEVQTARQAGLAQAQQIQQIQNQLQQITAQVQTQEQANQRLARSQEQAQAAVQLCRQHQADDQAYRAAEAALQSLDQQHKVRQQLWQQRQQYQAQLGDRQTRLTRLTLQFENLTQAERDLQSLQPLVQQQIALEQQRLTIAEKLQALQALRLSYQTAQQQIRQLQTHLATLNQDLQQTQSLAPVVEQIPDLEQQRDRLQQQLSRIAAAQQFESELQQLVRQGRQQYTLHQNEAATALQTLKDLQDTVPLIAMSSVDSVRAALQSGVTLNQDLLSALQQILNDLAEQVSAPRLRQQLQAVKTQLEQAYGQRAQLGTLTLKQTQQQQLQQDLQQQQSHLQDLQTQLQAETTYRQQQDSLNHQLQELQDPRGRSQLLQQQLQQKTKIQGELADVQTAQTAIQKHLEVVEAQLADLAELDQHIEAQKALRQQHQAGYLTYLQNEKAAQTLPQLEAEMQAAIAQLQTLSQQQTALQAEYDALAQSFDAEQMQQLEATYSRLKSQADQIMGGLPEQRKLLAEIDQQVAALQATADQRDRTVADLKERDRVRRFISFARKAYKQAGPRITELYVHNISREADRLFRELLNRPNVALEWTRDYDIIVQEGAHSRRFVNLSGGEQMCAALAVRLALLKILADIDIAFFDEPTTNMDRARRDSLAEAIARIKSFEQLFVISHDDTFEKVTENVILVEREA